MASAPLIGINSQDEKKKDEKRGGEYTDTFGDEKKKDEKSGK